MYVDGFCVAQLIQCFKKESPKTNQPAEKKANPKKPKPSPKSLKSYSD